MKLLSMLAVSPLLYVIYLIINLVKAFSVSLRCVRRDIIRVTESRDQHYGYRPARRSWESSRDVAVHKKKRHRRGHRGGKKHRKH